MVPTGAAEAEAPAELAVVEEEETALDCDKLEVDTISDDVDSPWLFKGDADTNEIDKRTKKSFPVNMTRKNKI